MVHSTFFKPFQKYMMQRRRIIINGCRLKYEIHGISLLQTKIFRNIRRQIRDSLGVVHSSTSSSSKGRNKTIIFLEAESTDMILSEMKVFKMFSMTLLWSKFSYSFEKSTNILTRLLIWCLRDNKLTKKVLQTYIQKAGRGKISFSL